MGVGQPCPAYWYQYGPGRPHKRCPRCEERRLWVAFEHVCAFCGKPILHSKKRGRPRSTCSVECRRGQRAWSERQRRKVSLAFY
jgi:hypothetical protein